MGVGSSEHTQHASQQAPPMLPGSPGCQARLRTVPAPVCSKRGEAWTRARYFRATPRTLRCILSPQPFLTAAYRRRICHLLPCVLSSPSTTSTHPPPSTLPHAVIHLGTMSKQVNLPSTCPYSAHLCPHSAHLCPHTLCASLMPARRAILRALALLAFARSVKVQRCPRPGSLPGSSARRTY